MESYFSDVSPSTLPVRLHDEGVEVEYLDGRVVFYHGVPSREEDDVLTGPGKQVHVLVTAPDEREGVLTYVNDRKTDDEILEASGVGRVLLESGEETDLFPGVTVRKEAYQVRVEADPEAARGRVFVFAEDERSERSYEIVSPD